MSLASTRREGMAMAESLMTDACRITRADASASRVLNATTGEYSDPTPLTVYEGKCIVTELQTRFDRVVQAGGMPTTLVRMFVCVPLDDTVYEVGDVVTVTQSSDPAFTGKQLRVREPQFGSLTVERRLGCELNAG